MQALEVLLQGPKGTMDHIEAEEAVALRMLMPTWDDEDYPYLRYIDPYDYTVFNSNQMPPLLEEIDRVIERRGPEDSRNVLQHLRRMIVSCQEDVGRYLRFEGD